MSEHLGVLDCAISRRDPLTKIVSFEEFSWRYQDIKEKNKQNGVVLFLFADADNLKEINDTFGHAFGDQLISRIANLLVTNLPTNAIICRKGGDEFIAAMSCANVPAAKKIASEIANILNTLHKILDHEILISCSIGAVIGSFQNTNLSMHLKQSDAAMYWAKKEGKGCIRVFNEEACYEIMMLQELSAQFPAAITNSELTLQMQPIYNMPQRRIIGAEALVRWIHAKYGNIPAQTIVSLASKTGRMNTLNLYMLKRACEEAKSWPSDVYVSVNFSAKDFLRSDLAPTISDILSQTSLNPLQLRIEITEVERLEEKDIVLANISGLQAKGVKVGIDDFGTGYSTLTCLDNFPLDFVKIDRSLVTNCERKSSSKIFLNAIRQVSNKLGIEVIAEGIERVEEAAVVRSVGVMHGQGYHFAVPLKPVQFFDLLKRPHKEWYNLDILPPEPN